METGSVLLRCRRTVTSEGVRDTVVGIDQDGRIAGVWEPGAAPSGLPSEDLGDVILMPGLVDCHVHVNQPGRTEWEGFETATRAAAAGGITTLVDMPLNCLPVTTSAAALDTKLRASRGELWVDCGFWGGVVPGNARELGALCRAGALGAKAFLVHSGIDEFPNAREADLREAMPLLARAGVPLLVHAELDVGVEEAPEGLSPRDYRRYLASRPRAWEDAAIALMIRLCRETGCAVHIVHLSSGSALELLADARAEGLPLTVETCPHYLTLDAEGIAPGHTAFKCAPPIREAQNRELLWQGLTGGVIDFVVSDHSPCTPALKLPEEGDFERAWGGIASLQLGLALVWTEARRRGHGPEAMARWLSEGPARFAGLHGRKGAIQVGRQADLVAWDPDACWTVQADLLHQRHKVSPYLGRQVEGRVLATWLGGKKVFEAGGFPAISPRGRAILGRDA
jgi:allantoinase